MIERPRILVINPNSNEAVTAGIAAALEPLSFATGPSIVCETLKEGPFGVETQAHVESVAVLVRERIAADKDAAAAYVIACYSDPGLHAAREATKRPVFGIAECGLYAALARADRFGVIAIKQRSIRRHYRYMRQIGVMERMAGERALEMSVAETASGEGTLARMTAIGRALRDEDGAEVIVMGCAGMARHRKPLEDTLGIPVIDPTQAAVAMAIGTVMTAVGGLH